MSNTVFFFGGGGINKNYSGMLNNLKFNLVAPVTSRQQQKIVIEPARSLESYTGDVGELLTRLYNNDFTNGPTPCTSPVLRFVGSVC